MNALFCLTLVIPTIGTIRSFPIMSYTTYATLRHKIPYIYKIEQNNQHLFYFGAHHSCDPNDRQYQLLEQFWQEFLSKTQNQPCVVLVEGNVRTLMTTKEEAITAAGGEGGYITLLAHQQNIPVFCPEPRKSLVVQELLKDFSVEEIAYMEFAQAALSACRYSNALGNAFDAEAFIAEHLADFSYFFTTCFYERTFAHETISQIHRNLFEHELNLRDEAFFYTITNPASERCIINAVCRKRSMLRDSMIVKHIENFLSRGKSVFVVYGATHAVMQQDAITQSMALLIPSA